MVLMRPYRVKITCILHLVVLLHGILFFIGASDKQNKMKTIVCLLHHRTVSRFVVIKKNNKKCIGIYIALYPDAQSSLPHFVGDFARLLI